jgi:hypothetical protein
MSDDTLYERCFWLPPARTDRLGEPKPLFKCELAAPSLGAYLRAVVMSGPVPAHRATQIFDDLGDPLIVVRHERRDPQRRSVVFREALGRVSARRCQAE